MKLFVALLLSASLLFSSTGCATLLRGTSQTIMVRTNPPGGNVEYQGRKLTDGEMLHVQKRLEPARVYVDSVPRDLHYGPDPLLIGDAVLLFFFVVPGLIALGIDFGTGAWRDFHDTQYFYVREPATH